MCKPPNLATTPECNGPNLIRSWAEGWTSVPTPGNCFANRNAAHTSGRSRGSFCLDFGTVLRCGHRNRFLQTLNLRSLIPSGPKVLNKEQEPRDENRYACKDEKDNPKILFVKANVSHKCED